MKMTPKYLERIAIYPGTFDPFTIGHKSIVERGLTLFDKIIIAVGINDAKRCYRPTEARVRHIEKVMADEPPMPTDRFREWKQYCSTPCPNCNT